MKNVGFAFLMIFSLSIQAMERENNTSACGDIPGKLIPLIHEMDAKQLINFCDHIRRAFQTLEEKEIIQVPFTPRQADIINFHYPKSLSRLIDGIWKVCGHQKESTISFVEVLRFYNGLQTIPQLFGVGSHPPLSTENSTAHWPLLSPYVNALRTHQVQPLLQSSEVATLSKDPKLITKINASFYGFQHANRSITKLTPWHCLKMRYYLTKLSHHMMLPVIPVKTKHEEEETGYASLFSGQASDFEEFIQDVKKFSETLKNQLSMPILSLKKNQGLAATGEQPSKKIPSQEIKFYRQTLKIFFNQYPSLKTPELDEEKTHKILDFWKLYLELTKTFYSSNSGTKDPSLNVTKVTQLCNKLLPYTYEEADVARVLEKPEMPAHLEGLLNAFNNPFSPKLYEILTYTYSLSKLTDGLDELDFLVDQSAFSFGWHTLTNLFTPSSKTK